MQTPSTRADDGLNPDRWRRLVLPELVGRSARPKFLGATQVISPTTRFVAMWGASSCPRATLELMASTFPRAQIVSAYGQTEEATREAFAGGWFHSGDPARREVGPRRGPALRGRAHDRLRLARQRPLRHAPRPGVDLGPGADRRAGGRRARPRAGRRPRVLPRRADRAATRARRAGADPQDGA